MSQAKITEVELRKLLSKGVVQIVFKKKDGAIRTLNATLKADLLPEVEVDPTKPKRSYTAKPGMVNVYVPELKSWRGFNMNQLIDMNPRL